VVRADLVADAAGLLDPGWLTAQRWYGANDLHLREVTLADAAPTTADGDRSAWLLVVEASFVDAPQIRYLIPAVADREGGRLREPNDGEGTWRGLSAAILDHAVLNGEAGSFRSEPAGAIDELVPGGAAAVSGLEERRLGVEQTNTSVTLGDRLILKVYRRLESGENPELEVGAFLESVGCRVVPRMAGAIWYLREASAAAAMLQERVHANGDAWRQLKAMLAGAEGGPEAALEAAARIGSVTAELHAALAARPQDLSFPVRTATEEEQRGWLADAMRQADRAERAANGADAEQLAPLLPPIRKRIERSFAAAGRARVTRIHGDYHLGQLLRTDDGYAVVDFEGEPARPLAMRRAPSPPERDLAGMLRSLDYAARTVEREGADALAADDWLARARGAFLSAYKAEAPAPPDPNLLEAFELEKACYELAYEAANRPDWTWLPLEALARLV
jgi:maltokinase